MRVATRLIIFNILSYISFLLYIFCSVSSTLKGWSVLFVFSTYLLVAFSSFIFNFRVDPLLKNVLKYSIPDFILRLVAMFVSFYAITFNYRGYTFKLFMLLLSLFLACNMILEQLISTEFSKLESKRTYRELTATEVINNNSDGVVNLGASSAIESVILVIINFIIIGYSRKLGIKYLSFIVPVIVILLFLYVIETMKTLNEYYKDKKVVKKIFWHENIGVFIMIMLLGIYSYLFGFDGLKDFIAYLLIVALILPRVFSRRNRIEEIYKKHMTEKIEKR